jgi:hypothetical protein
MTLSPYSRRCAVILVAASASFITHAQSKLPGPSIASPPSPEDALGSPRCGIRSVVSRRSPD